MRSPSLSRLISFHAAWSLVLVLASIVGHEIFPSESYDRGFYLLTLPLGWLILFFVLLPVTAIVGWLIGQATTGGRQATRRKAIIISVSTWWSLALLIAGSTPVTSEARWQAAIALAIAAPLHGLLFPLPRATEGNGDQAV
jgi:hypothetical protein